MVSLLTLLGLITTVLVIALAQMFLVEKSLSESRASSQELGAEEASLRAEDQRLKAQLAALVRERSPDLRPVQPGRMISIDEGLVQDLLFTEAGTEAAKWLDYKVVLRNGSPETVRVRLKILFYNRAGVQVGEAKIGVIQADPDTPVQLDGGETTSFSGRVESDPASGAPAYFKFAVGG